MEKPNPLNQLLAISCEQRAQRLKRAKNLERGERGEEEVEEEEEWPWPGSKRNPTEKIAISTRARNNRATT